MASCCVPPVVSTVCERALAGGELPRLLRVPRQKERLYPTGRGDVFGPAPQDRVDEEALVLEPSQFPIVERAGSCECEVDRPDHGSRFRQGRWA
jgi:hypothetical protein